jgi:hypothetical protein
MSIEIFPSPLSGAFLQSPTGIMEIKAGWILMLGFTPESSGALLEEDSPKMIKSAK